MIDIDCRGTASIVFASLNGFLCLLDCILGIWILVNFCQRGYIIDSFSCCGWRSCHKCTINNTRNKPLRTSKKSKISPKSLVDARLVFLSVVAIVSFILISIEIALINILFQDCVITGIVFNLSKFGYVFLIFNYMAAICVVYCILSFKLIRMYQNSLYQLSRCKQYGILFAFLTQILIIMSVTGMESYRFVFFILLVI